MHGIAVFLLFSSATCGAACKAENEGDSQECKLAKQSLCTAKQTLGELAEEGEPGEPRLTKLDKAVKDARVALKTALAERKKAKKNKRNAKNQKLSACWSMDRLDDWLKLVPHTGQCVSTGGNIMNSFLPTVTLPLEECIQWLADSPMAIGLSYQYHRFPRQDTGRCRVLYENEMGHIDTTRASGDENFQCYARKSALKKDPIETKLDDVSLVELGQGECLNSKEEANYHGTSTSSHVVTKKSTCFQMFEDGLPEAVGMTYNHLHSTCRVLYDHSSIGEIMETTGNDRYTCYKRSTPADNRRLRAEDELPVV